MRGGVSSERETHPGPWASNLQSNALSAIDRSDFSRDLSVQTCPRRSPLENRVSGEDGPFRREEAIDVC